MYLLVLVVLAGVVFAPLLAPYDPAAQDIASRLQGPSAQHLLGTDALGRDLLLGVLAGYLGGRIDRLLVVVMDSMQAFPAVILALTLRAVLHRGRAVAGCGPSAHPGPPRRPNIIAPLLILVAINVPVAVTVAAGLSFLGLGVPPPAPSWG